MINRKGKKIWVKLRCFVMLTFMVLASSIAQSAQTPTYNSAYVVDNISSDNISVTGSPYSMVIAYYRGEYGVEYAMEDISIDSFATLWDKIVLYFDYPDKACAKAKIIAWTWHPHYVAITLSDGTNSLTARLTVVDNTVVLKLEPTNLDVVVITSIRNSGIDYGGILVTQQASGQFHIEEDRNSSYPRVGSFIDVKLSDTSYDSYSVYVDADPSAAIAAQLDGTATDLDNNASDSKYATFNYGITAVNYNNGWDGPLTLSFSYSAVSFADAESHQYSNYDTAQSDARTKWITYLDKAPHIEPYIGTEMYWKSWAILGINGEDHTTMPAGKYDFADTVEYITGNSLERQVIGHHKNIAAAVPNYPRYWHLDNLWAPATLTYSGQQDVLHSMVGGVYDIYNTLGNVTDVWMDGKRNGWDNYQSCYFGDLAYMAYHMTGDSYYLNEGVFVNIRNQQVDNYKHISYDPLFHNPLTFGYTINDAEPLSSWRTGSFTSLLEILAELNPGYAGEYNDYLASMDYFWYPGTSSPDDDDYRARCSDGSWAGGGGLCEAVFFNPSLNYAENAAARSVSHGYITGPMSILLLTLNGDLERADTYRKDIFKVSDYFAEGTNSNFEPDSPNAEIHMSYTAHTEILAKIGLIPYATPGYNGFVIAPNVTDVNSITGIHYANGTIELNYHGSGLYTAIYLNGSRVVNNKINFIPFSDLNSDSANTIDVYFYEDTNVELIDLALAWLSRPGNDNWDPVCDISEPADNIVNLHDFAVFARTYSPDPPAEGIIEDFEDVSDWSVIVGSAAVSGAIACDAGEAQVGIYAGAMNYGHSTATGFDYIDYAKSFDPPLDLSGADSLDFYAKLPNDPDCYISMHILTTDGWLEYYLPEGNGVWQLISLPIASFTDWGTTPNMSEVTLIRFRSVGDASGTATSGTFYIDNLLEK